MTTLKILAIGDQHFESKNETETLLMCQKIYDIIVNEQPDIVVSLGDTLHTHGLIHMNPYKRAIDFFFQMSQMVKHLYIIVGNHERNSNQNFLTDESPFVACKTWKNTTVVDNVTIHKDESHSIVLVPYVPVGRFMEALATKDIRPENMNNYSLFFAHQEFKGARMGAIVSTHGDEWDINYPLCISGHVHDYQVIQPNLIYPGTPLQLSFGSAPSKGVMMIRLESHSNLSSDPTYEFIDLALPRKLIVHLTPEQLSTYQPPENASIKIVCKGDSKAIREVTKLDSVKEMLKNPRVKLSIQEDRQKKNLDGSVIVAAKTESVPFQKRLYSSILSQNEEVQTIFKSLFGEIQESG